MPIGKPAVLVVDDDLDFLALIADLLKCAGFSVFTATNGMEAFARFLKEPCDVVLTDVQMKGGGGIELFKEIQARYPGTPVFFMTGNSTPSLERCPGIKAVFSKPFDVALLVEALKASLKRDTA